MSRRWLALLVVGGVLWVRPALAARGSDVAHGLVFGTVFGMIGGGIALQWAANQDDNYQAYIFIGGSVGMIGGLAYGLLLPPEEAAPAPAATALPPPALLACDWPQRSWALDIGGVWSSLVRYFTFPAGAVQANLFALQF